MREPIPSVLGCEFNQPNAGRSPALPNQTMRQSGRADGEPWRVASTQLASCHQHRVWCTLTHYVYVCALSVT